MMINPNFWLITPLITLVGFVASLIWYKGLLEGSEGSIETKGKAIQTRKALLTALRKTCVSSFFVGIFGTALISAGIYFGLFRGYSAFVFFVGFASALLAVFYAVMVMSQAAPRVATDFQTSQKEGAASLFQAAALTACIVVGIVVFAVSTSLYFLHTFYDSNVLGMSMHTVQYLGYSFWNDAIRFLPTFQALSYVDAAQTTVFIFLGLVTAWITLRRFNKNEAVATAIDHVLEMATTLAAVGVTAIVFGTAILNRHPDLPQLSAIIPLFVLGLFVAGLLLTRLFKTPSPLVVVASVLAGTVFLFLIHALPLIGAISLVFGLLLGGVFSRLFPTFSYLPLLTLLAAIFFFSGGFLSEGKAWYFISLGALGFVGMSLFETIGLFSSQIMLWGRAFDPTQSLPSQTDSPTPVILGATFYSGLLLSVGAIELFKQQLVFLAHLTIVKLGALQFSTMYSFISTSRLVYDLSACDLSDLFRLLNVSFLNPKLLLGFFVGLALVRTSRFQQVLMVATPLLMGLCIGFSSLVGLHFGLLACLFQTQDERTSKTISLVLKTVLALSILGFPIFIKFGFHF